MFIPRRGSTISSVEEGRSGNIRVCMVNYTLFELRRRA